VIASTALDATAVDLTGRLAALADPVRLRIVGVLAAGGRCVCDLRHEVPVPANLLSYHLRVLRESGLVAARRRGRWIDYRLDPNGFDVLWRELGEAGVPRPGEPVTDAMAGRACSVTEVKP
jgi:ArsR family transcriptional regulator